MEIFFVAAVVTALLLTAGALLSRNLRYKALATLNRKYGALVLLAGAVLIASDVIAGADSFAGVPVELMLPLFALSMLTGSFLDGRQKKAAAYTVTAISAFLSVYYILCALGVFDRPGRAVFVAAAVLESLAYMLVFVWSMGMEIRNIHSLMQSGTVWGLLCRTVDSLYGVMILFLMAVYLAFPDCSAVQAGVSVLMSGMLFAFASRLASDSVFAILHRHERRIVESMRISPVEPVAVSAAEENVYKELFERVQAYFDEEKPFLNGNLTINDVVVSVFSNKVYISRAISRFTGRNFCQYVNYHRVMYSMECFRNNMDLKISELWPMCGFNSIVSFNMAFRLFMEENPSEWCRKEKIRLSKKRK